MIVDDQHMIIGSANINDRSLRGKRDSELAVYIRGQPDKKLQAMLHGKKRIIEVNRTIHNFRKQIFASHFDMPEKEVLWPADEYTWRACLNIAKLNTQFYDKAFNSLPSNKFRKYEDIKNEIVDSFDEKAFEDLSPLVHGYAVCYPYKFLKDAHLEFAKNKEIKLWLAPFKLFL